MMLRFLTAGESHGPSMTAILDGMPAGLALSEEVINRELARRQKGFGSGGRMKIEKDVAQILGGVMAGETTGAPIALLVNNVDHAKWKGKAVAPMTAPRPGHADLTGAVKYGYKDLRPALERASARETVMRVAVGAVCKKYLSEFGIVIGGYVAEIGGIRAELGDMPYDERFARAEESDARCPDESAAKKMRAAIEAIIRAKDTLGGVLEIVALNLPAGLGGFSQWDKRLEARLGMAILSVQAIKGVEFGEAFANARVRGTEGQDRIYKTETGKQVDTEIGKHGNGENVKYHPVAKRMGRKTQVLTRDSNRAGGIEGGISNGQPIVIRAAMKPIATTLTPQQTVDLASGEETLTQYERSDFCPVPRAVPILEAMTAFVLADALIEKLGGDSINEMKPRFEALRKMSLNDLKMDGEERVWWE